MFFSLGVVLWAWTPKAGGNVFLQAWTPEAKDARSRNEPEAIAASVSAVAIRVDF